MHGKVTLGMKTDIFKRLCKYENKRESGNP